MLHSFTLHQVRIFVIVRESRCQNMKRSHPWSAAKWERKQACWCSARFSHFYMESNPRGGTTNFKAGLSTLVKMFKPIPLDTPVGQCDLDNSSFRIPSQVILDYVQLTIKPKHMPPVVYGLFQFMFRQSCWWDFIDVASGITRRHGLTANSLTLWFLQSSHLLFCKRAATIGRLVWLGKVYEAPVLYKGLQATKECWMGEIIFPTEEHPVWLSSTKWSALKQIHTNSIIQTKQVTFRNMNIYVILYT